MSQWLNGFWVGERLNFVARLCLKSMLAAGHKVRLYSYDPGGPAGIPDGVELHDAAEIMPRSELRFYTGEQRSRGAALAANLFRYNLLAQGKGAWVDLDMLLLRPLDLQQSYVFGAEEQGTINNAVLAAPADSELVRQLRLLPQDDRRPPWYGPRRTFLDAWNRLLGRPRAIENRPWGTYGPEMLTYLVRKLGLQRFVAPPDAFYPIDWRTAAVLNRPSTEVERHLTARTQAIHLYNSQLELVENRPAKGSFLADQAERVGLAY